MSDYALVMYGAGVLAGLLVGWLLGYDHGKEMAAALLEQSGIDRDVINRALGWWRPEQ